MSSPYIGEIRLFAGNFPPAGWMFCDGQLLPISENDTLFWLIGTTYGGDGVETFALPDLRGRVAIHQGAFPGGETYTLGETGGMATKSSNSSQTVTTGFNVQRGLAVSATSGPPLLPAVLERRNMLGLRYIISLFGILPTSN